MKPQTLFSILKWSSINLALSDRFDTKIKWGCDLFVLGKSKTSNISNYKYIKSERESIELLYYFYTSVNRQWSYGLNIIRLAIRSDAERVIIPAPPKKYNINL